jgi:hypothetical protein
MNEQKHRQQQQQAIMVLKEGKKNSFLNGEEKNEHVRDGLALLSSPRLHVARSCAPVRPGRLVTVGCPAPPPTRPHPISAAPLAVSLTLWPRVDPPAHKPGSSRAARLLKATRAAQPAGPCVASGRLKLTEPDSNERAGAGRGRTDSASHCDTPPQRKQPTPCPSLACHRRWWKPEKQQARRGGRGGHLPAACPRTPRDGGAEVAGRRAAVRRLRRTGQARGPPRGVARRRRGQGQVARPRRGALADAHG